MRLFTWTDGNKCLSVHNGRRDRAVEQGWVEALGCADASAAGDGRGLWLWSQEGKLVSYNTGLCLCQMPDNMGKLCDCNKEQANLYWINDNVISNKHQFDRKCINYQESN